MTPRGNGRCHTITSGVISDLGGRCQTRPNARCNFLLLRSAKRRPKKDRVSIPLGCTSCFCLRTLTEGRTLSVGWDLFTDYKCMSKTYRHLSTRYRYLSTDYRREVILERGGFSPCASRLCPWCLAAFVCVPHEACVYVVFVACRRDAPGPA